MKYLLNKIIFLIAAAAMIFATGCDLNSDEGTGTMTVWLHDDPADFEEVQVFIEAVEVQRQNEEGWQVINEPNQHFDLLELTNGAYTVLGEAELEAGMYSQIRLIVSREDNYVIEKGDEEPKSLFVPSGTETGVKLNVNAEIVEGIQYTLLLDFDAHRSVVSPGSSGNPADYLLQPVIRTVNVAETGNIGGTVTPSEATVQALQNNEVVTTTNTDPETGEFLLFGLEEGFYSVSIDAEGFENMTIDDVEVTLGETNDLGDLELETTEN